MKKRSRVDICADILEVLKPRPEGALITRIAYGARMPIDRLKPMLQTLSGFGFRIEVLAFQAKCRKRCCPGAISGDIEPLTSLM